MSSVLDHYNNYTTNSKFQWEGLKSAKFGRTKQFLPPKDLISPGFDFPYQVNYRGMKHFQQKNSQQKKFRSSLGITPKIKNWHPRQSKKKILDIQFTKPYPRRQKSHVKQDFIYTQRIAGIRTFYNTKIRQNNSIQYSIQDKMQRKTRVDQNMLRRTFFNKETNKTFF